MKKRPKAWLVAEDRGGGKMIKIRRVKPDKNGEYYFNPDQIPKKYPRGGLVFENGNPNVFDGSIEDLKRA